MNDSLNFCLFDSHHLAFRHCRRGRQTLRLSDQASFADKFVLPQQGDDGFLSLLGYDSDFDLALLDIENRIGLVALGKNDVFLLIPGNVATDGHRRQKHRRIKQRSAGCFAVFASLDRHIRHRGFLHSGESATVSQPPNAWAQNCCV